MVPQPARAGGRPGRVGARAVTWRGGTPRRGAPARRDVVRRHAETWCAGDGAPRGGDRSPAAVSLPARTDRGRRGGGVHGRRGRTV